MENDTGVWYCVSNWNKITEIIREKHLQTSDYSENIRTHWEDKKEIFTSEEENSTLKALRKLLLPSQSERVVFLG